MPALIVPVAGVTPDRLRDTWGEARTAGRVHQGIDIMAPAGTPVLAADDGRVAKLFLSEAGGITLYQFDQSVRRGELIAEVGATGNARDPHLHFEIGLLGPERRWWVSEPLNPYGFLAD